MPSPPALAIWRASPDEISGGILTDLCAPAGGNQRDIDRARAEKRKAKQTNHDKDGLTVAQRKER